VPGCRASRKIFVGRFETVCMPDELPQVVLRLP